MKRSTKRAYNKWASTYDDAPHILHFLEKDLILSLIDPKKGDKILDAACGTGSYAIAFVNNGAAVIGVDISQKMLDVTRRKIPNVKFFVVDIERKLPFDDEIFNKINCAQGLQHIENIAPVLKEFKRLIRKNGSIVFSVPHPEMDRTYYKKNVPKTESEFKGRAVLFEHKFYEYFEAIDKARLKIQAIKQVPIANNVRQFFELEIFKKVEGKYLGLIFKLAK